ncbi:filamentous hemagglutinin N-terminal domain-containing protein [Aliarcobacter cryaerophilus]|uniref:filamentous hemagglutinin N-terminal domain-containing protein n=1 Tax=Aliarcobacter cryaerophilus TaxID=28198 RepID=UPI003BB1E890
MKRKFKKIVAIKVVIFLLLQQTLIAGGLVVDNNAPKQNQANIESARNGVPVVNIVTPNQSGLSHNKFSDYNVNKEGLILNNSNKIQTNTQLAGYIYGNENLRNGTATTILNEVTSKNKTHLRGFTEVAGDRANVVVANPNGIYINGAGFINTYKATITTGNPNIQNGALNGFDVRGGHIDIDGDGLNSSNVNKAELYAQTLKLNAKIYAQNLDIVTGKNSISTDGTIKNIENINDEKPILALDSSSLGGIYANKINLIGTSKGVGVNLPIEITAQDDFKLSADGKIVLDKVIAEKNIDIKSSSDSINTNIIYANNVNMEAKDSITNEEIIVAQENIDLKAKDIINKNAIATLNKDINITAKNLTNYNTIYSNDSINLYVEDTLLNTTNNDIVDLGNEKATIFAVNSINIQGDKDKTQRTQNVVNDKSIIKTQNKDINIYANSLKNLNDEAVIGVNDGGSGMLFFGVANFFQDLYVQTSFDNLGENAIINNLRAENIEVTTEKVLEKLRDKYSYLSHIMTAVYSPSSGIFDYYLRITNPNYIFTFSRNYLINYSSKKDYFITKPLLKAGAEIVSNNNINFDVLNLENKISTISAKNNILFTNTTLNNISNSIYQYSNISGGSDICPDKCTSFFITPSTSQIKLDSLDSIIEAGNSISGTLTQLNNENQARVSNVEFTPYSPSNNSLLYRGILEKNKDLNDEYILPTNKYGMFVSVDPNKNLDYLVESNPLYTNYSNFIGSSYFLEKMNYQGDRKTKRLGDAGYETKLVSDAIFRLTGQRTLNPDFQSENEQFVALMDSAVNLSGILDLELGKPLSQQQLANLTQDIVWMEEQIVDGKLVLVPVVYLAKDYEYLKGASIVAKNIDLDIKDSLNNSGTIKTNENMNISANSITNNAGVLLSKGKATLISNDDFVNKNGGSIKGSDVQIASINGSVINETYSNTNNLKFGINDFTYTNIGKTSSIEATNGNLVIQAKNDITNIGANLSATNSLLLQTQNGDINLNAIKLEQGYNVYFKGGFDKSKDVQYQTSNIYANNILMQSGNNINLEASKLNANNQINLNAQNDVNILALNSEYYRDTQTTTKGFMSKKTQRDMEYKESVNSAQLNANDIYMTSGNDINLEAVNINAKNEKIAYAQNSLNILAKTYKEGELHHTSKSSWGGMIKNEYKYEKDNLKIKSSEISANNMILDAKTINVEASKLKANSMEITTEILNMISSKESLYENEFSIKGGILTATIENKGKTQEVVIPSTIEVNDKLIFNKKDITDQLETDNLIKTLSSQGNLTVEQINLVKQIANSKEWHDKTTTLSGVGALIITVIVTYFTAGAGTGLVAGVTGAAATGAAASTAAIVASAATQAVIVQATTSLVTAAITGNKPQLDLDSLAKSAVTAGILSYANSVLDGVENLDKVTKTVTNTTIQSGVQSAVFKTDFKDTLLSNLAMAGTNLTFESVGDYELYKLKQGSLDFSDGSLSKILLHSLVGGTVSAIQDKDILSGILSAGFREALSPLTANSSDEAKLLASQLTGILVGGLAGGEEGANNGYIISTSGELYNRQLHQDEIKKIYSQVDDFSSKTGLSKEKSLELLTLAGNMLVDENTYNEYTNSTKYIGVDFLPKDVENAMSYLLENSQGKTFLDMPTQQTQEYFTSQDYMYKNSDWNPNTKEFYYVPNMINKSDKDMFLNVIRGKTDEEISKLFISRIQSDISKGFTGLGNSLNQLYNLDTSKMTPQGRLMFDYLNLKAVTVPTYGGSKNNPVNQSSDILINEINKVGEKNE